MKASTIRGIRSILSGAFAAAQRWEWTDRNPTRSAKPPTTIRRGSRGKPASMLAVGLFRLALAIPLLERALADSEQFWATPIPAR